MSLISGRFHWLASNRFSLPLLQPSLSLASFRLIPARTRIAATRLASRRFATVAP